jgi:magnesium chelatase family protein
MEFQFICGMEHHKRALEVAASGGHKLAIIGAPGSGKRTLRDAGSGLGMVPGQVLLFEPCKCGYLGDKVHRCTCRIQSIEHHVSAMLKTFERQSVDMAIAAEAVSIHKLLRFWNLPDDCMETTDMVLKRVQAAQTLACERQGVHNADLTPGLIREHCRLDEPCMALYRRAHERLGLHTGDFMRIMRVSRTVADLDGAAGIAVMHLAEAIQYRAGVKEQAV